MDWASVVIAYLFILPGVVFVALMAWLIVRRFFVGRQRYE